MARIPQGPLLAPQQSLGAFPASRQALSHPLARVLHHKTHKGLHLRLDCEMVISPCLNLIQAGASCVVQPTAAFWWCSLCNVAERTVMVTTLGEEWQSAIGHSPSNVIQKACFKVH